MVQTMLYRRYKASYSDCETIPGTYNKASKTIDVIIPDNRIKKSGVRGQSYKYLTFHGIENATNRPVRITIKAVSLANAIKRLPKDCTWDVG